MFKKTICTALAVIMLVTFGAMSVFASETPDMESIAVSEDKVTIYEVENALAAGQVEFKDLEKYPVQSYTGIDAEGNKYTVGIEPADPRTRAGKEWKVYYYGAVLNCHFYMNVTNNRCMSVYSPWLLCILNTASNTRLWRSTTQGQYEFISTIVGGYASYQCWLRGTVTGSGDNIYVNWQM